MTQLGFESRAASGGTTIQAARLGHNSSVEKRDPLFQAKRDGWVNKNRAALLTRSWPACVPSRRQDLPSSTPSRSSAWTCDAEVTKRRQRKSNNSFGDNDPD